MTTSRWLFYVCLSVWRFTCCTSLRVQDSSQILSKHFCPYFLCNSYTRFCATFINAYLCINNYWCCTHPILVLKLPCPWEKSQDSKCISNTSGEKKTWKRVDGWKTSQCSSTPPCHLLLWWWWWWWTILSKGIFLTSFPLPLFSVPRIYMASVSAWKLCPLCSFYGNFFHWLLRNWV